MTSATEGTTAGDVSQWATTQARVEVSCSKCGATTGEPCRQPSGRVTPQHAERGKAYIEKIGHTEFFKRHRCGRN